MLSDSQVLEVLQDSMKDVDLNVITDFTDSNSANDLCKHIFAAKLQPILPALCFLEESENDKNLKSFFDLADPNYTLVPFGKININTRANTTRLEEYGMSYNAFCNSLAIQSYTVCIKQVAKPVKRVDNQVEPFHEYNVRFAKRHGWSAGHLVAHQFTPEYASDALAATRQLLWNFIPEPDQWNCHQRSHLEKACAKNMKFYGVYPIYSLRYRHGRTTRSVVVDEKTIPYRPLPDGEFFVGDLSKQRTLESIFIPFIAPNGEIYNAKREKTRTLKTKLAAAIHDHKVNNAACPQSIAFNFENPTVLTRTMNTVVDENSRIADAQGNLFSNDENNALHQTALVRYERAATHEIKSPKYKMECALLFSSLLNPIKKQRYISATKQHAELLLDKCEADLTDRLLTFRDFKRFSDEFVDETATIDVLKRITPTY